MKIIGIDLGTTSICGVLVDADSGEVDRVENRASDAFIKSENVWEKIQDTEKYVSIATDILNSLIDGAAEDIAAVGVTGQMHGIVYVNAEGMAVSPLYTWQDGRGGLPYRDSTYAEHLGSFSGYGNVTDFYNRVNALVPTGAVTYATVHDYLVMRLTGSTVPYIHASDAASFGLYNAAEKRFDYPYSALITDGFEIAGRYRGIPVSVAIGDNQASVLSTLASDEDLLINVGTGSQVSVISDKPVIAGNVETRPYFDGKYLVVGSALCGGRAYSLLKNFYQTLFEKAGIEGIDIYSLMSEFVKGKDKPTLSVDTRFDGTRSDPSLRGSITNLGVSNFTPEDFTAGVLYGIIEELKEMYDSFGLTRRGIVASGNGIRKNCYLKYAAQNAFGSKVKIPVYTEEAAIGAALYALKAIEPNIDFKKFIKYAEEE